MTSEEKAKEISTYTVLLVKGRSVQGLLDYRVATVVPYLGNALFNGSQQDFWDECEDNGFPTLVGYFDGSKTISNGSFLDAQNYIVDSIIHEGKDGVSLADAKQLAA